MMEISISLLLFFLLFCASTTLCLSVPPVYRSLGSFAIDSPAFLNIMQLKAGDPQLLIISSFHGNPLASDDIYLVNDIGADLDNISAVVAVPLSDQVTWPNEATTVPFHIFNREAIVVAGGFLVPGKSTGAINLFDMSQSTPQGPFQVSEDKFEWFYHEVVWKDMNGDGLEDIVTARAIKPVIYGSPDGQLLWYEHPSSNPFGGPWKQHPIIQGPEFFFQFVDIDGDGKDELLATEFFKKQLVLYWTDTYWNDSSAIHSKAVDTTCGAPFDLQIVDVNNDGKMDVLMTNHENNASLSSVFAYEVPKDWKNSPWPRHTLASGFTTLVGGIGAASPGKAVAFQPIPTQNKTKPMILLGGDGSEKGYLITALSESSSDWSYAVKVVVDGGGTVGQVVVGDWNGDGYSDFMVPIYDESIIYAYTFAPSTRM